jgi:hypothetical protein
MKTTMIKAIGLAALFAALLGCQTATAKAEPAPAWMTELETTFPDARFMAAVGSGDTRREAEADASGALAARFRVEIKLDSQAVQRYSDLVAQDQSYSATERSVVQKVSTSANEQFINLAYSDPWTDPKGQVHIVAFLDRDKSASLYRGIIAKDARLVASLRQRAALSPGKLAAFALLDSAVAVSRNSERLLAQLQLIRPAATAEASALIDTAALARQRDEAVQGLGYRMDIEGDSDGKVAAMVKKSLAGFSLGARDDGQLSVRGRVSIEPEANPKYQTLRWSLTLSLVDETGTSIASFLKESKENGLSDSAARAYVYREMEKRVQADFTQAVNAYLGRVAAGK